MHRFKITWAENNEAEDTAVISADNMLEAFMRSIFTDDGSLIYQHINLTKLTIIKL